MFLREFLFFTVDQEKGEKQAQPTENEDTSLENNETKDVEMDDINNHCRAEGVIHFEIKNVSKIKETALSESVIIRNLPWFV